MPKHRDIGNEETERLLKQLEKRVTKEYEQAAKEVNAKFKDYMRRFEIKDKIKREAVAAGVLDKKDYIAWRQSQVMVGEKWQALLNDMSQDLTNAREIAISTAQGYREDAYAINHNFATYEIESQSQINTSYTLYDRQTVERLIREDPKLLPDPRPGGKTARMLAENKELRWNRQKLTSAVAQGIIQGESVPQMTKRMESVAAMDHRAAIRNVRTMVTGAQNAGRMDAAKRARDMGIGLTNVWMATLDMRTRHEHRVLDGQRREIDEPFEVEGEKIKYPGDPDAPAHLVYNCRCTLVQQVKGFEYDIRGDKDVDYSGIEGMTYDEWKEDRREKPNPITLPEEKAAAIKGRYIKEYKDLVEKTTGVRPKGGAGSTDTETTEDRHGTATGSKPVVPQFVQATTIEEAEEFVKQFVDESRFGSVGVSFAGVGLDVANEFNRTLAEHFALFDVEKIGGVIAPAGNTKLGKQVSSAYAGYSPIRKSFVLNRKNMKTMKIAEDGLAEEIRICKDVLQHPEKYDLTKMSTRARLVFKNAATSGRTLVPTTLSDSINHELGHSIERKVRESDLYEQVKQNREKYAPLVSGYACDDEGEYIAESWCSWRKGETVADPVLIRVFESFMRK